MWRHDKHGHGSHLSAEHFHFYGVRRRTISVFLGGWDGENFPIINWVWNIFEISPIIVWNILLSFYPIFLGKTNPFWPYDVFQMGWFNFKVCRFCHKVSPKSFLQIITSMKFHESPTSYSTHATTILTVAMGPGLKKQHPRHHLVAADEVSLHHWLSTVRCWSMGSFALAFHHHRSVVFLVGARWFGRRFFFKYQAARRWLHSYILFLNMF